MAGSFVVQAQLAPMTTMTADAGGAAPLVPLMVKGWELNKGKYMPRLIDLSSMMDPIR